MSLKNTNDLFIYVLHTGYQKNLSNVYKFIGAHIKRMNSLNFCRLFSNYMYFRKLNGSSALELFSRSEIHE
ncbi:hypothetical protein Hdeb2414_s0026g00673861 [Helianthus debilis subsp. tardiflorus]